MFNKVVAIWVLLLILEIGAGFFVYNKFQQYKEKQFNEAALAKIAVLDETKVKKSVDPELKYYWEFNPNDQVTDKPYWLKEMVVYSINADGLNDINDYPLEKELGTFRIITLGDSFTYGHYVNTSKNWTELLEKRLNESPFSCQTKKIEIINLGMPGFDVQEIVRRYKRIGQKYNPDMIIYLESGSGFERFNEIAFPMIQECIGYLPSEESTTSANQNSLQESVPADFMKIRGCWTSVSDKVMKDHSVFERKEMLEGYWQEFFQLTEDRPVWFFYHEDLSYVYDEIVKDWMKKYPDKQFLLTLPKPIEGKNIFIDNHPNELGHQEISQVIYKTLVDKKAVCIEE